MMHTAQYYETYKPLLFSIAYRMLGSVVDAEDIVQDAFLDLSDTDFRGMVHEKAYLCKVVSNKCMDRIRRSAKERQAYIGPWLPEPLVEWADEPAGRYLHRESLSTAYLLLLQQLSETERIVFLLREAFRFEYGEISVVVEKSEANCRQIFHRAKKAIQDRPESAVPQSENVRPLVEQFVDALQNGDIRRLMDVISEDVVLMADSGGKVAGSRVPIRTSERVVPFLSRTSVLLPDSFATFFVRVNGYPGLVLSREGKAIYTFSFQVQNDRIVSVFVVANPEKLAHLDGYSPS
ncbi:RNA polymerase sigma factor SigJ [Cohnella sp. REN36]|uniref:RNA polymerase sigma factor SigJ n=1 Tax=Cohnella sp. REN36 TaxID=2887347 RepID=UPI001D14C3B2|nr:RNA polymerase sigma factor SigJ [Cohnella sp. REN36]MCC3374289.1 RNA polymerase sigma factor SigJ [Cohnella sp. REN36]